MSNPPRPLWDMPVMSLGHVHSFIGRAAHAVETQGALCISIRGKLKHCIMNAWQFDSLISEAGNEAEQRYCSSLNHPPVSRVSDIQSKTMFITPKLISLTDKYGCVIAIDYAHLIEINSMLPPKEDRLHLRSKSIDHAIRHYQR